MDDDDELVSEVPPNEEIGGHDSVFFMLQKNGKLYSWTRCPTYKAHGFCGIICRRGIAEDALKWASREAFLRDDTAYFYYVAMNSHRSLMSDLPLINKIRDRLPNRSGWLRAEMRNETNNVWQQKMVEAQERLACL